MEIEKIQRARPIGTRLRRVEWTNERWCLWERERERDNWQLFSVVVAKEKCGQRFYMFRGKVKFYQMIDQRFFFGMWLTVIFFQGPE